MRELKKMKDSAAGPDEITAGMMRWACTIPKFRRHSFSLGLTSESMAGNAAPSHHCFFVETQGKPGRPQESPGHLSHFAVEKSFEPHCGSKTCSVCGTTRDFGHDAVWIPGSSVDTCSIGSGTKRFGCCHQTFRFTGAGPVLCGTSGFEKNLTRTRLGSPFTQ